MKQAAVKWRAGQALLIVLSLMAILSVLVLCLVQSSRNDRQTARQFLDRAHARQMLQVALSRAAEAIDMSIGGDCAPAVAWTNLPVVYEVTASLPQPGVAPIKVAPGRFIAAMTNLTPAFLWTEAGVGISNCVWQPVVVDSQTLGRVAFVVVSCSGMIDVNELAWQDGLLDALVSRGCDVFNRDRFVQDFTNHVRYETVRELGSLNQGVAPTVSNLFVYSYDANPDVFYFSDERLGTTNAALFPKCNLNSVTDTNQIAPVEYLLTNYIGVTPAGKAAWNVRNYIDADRIPDDGTSMPWQDDAALDAFPMINEVALQEVPGLSNRYEVVVELWYPFAPQPLGAGEGIVVRVEAYTNRLPVLVTNAIQGAWSFGMGVPAMRYGAGSEFICITSPPYCRIAFSNESGLLPIGSTNLGANGVWLDVRVGQSDSNGVWGLDEVLLGSTNGHSVLFTSVTNLAARDPRSNWSRDSWVSAPPTHGRHNGPGFRPAPAELPLYLPNTEMTSAGELGNLWVNDPSNGWQTIDLLSCVPGGAIMDLFTHQSARGPTRGLVSPNSRSPAVLTALFSSFKISDGVSTNELPLEPAGIAGIVNAITNYGYCNWRHLLFRGNKPPYLVDALSNCVELTCVTNGVVANDRYREDIVRKLGGLLTFRQNVFVLLLAAESTAADGITPLAAEHAVAILVRDAYTGRMFVRYFSGFVPNAENAKLKAES